MQCTLLYRLVWSDVSHRNGATRSIDHAIIRPDMFLASIAPHEAREHDRGLGVTHLWRNAYFWVVEHVTALWPEAIADHAETETKGFVESGDIPTNTQTTGGKIG